MVAALLILLVSLLTLPEPTAYLGQFYPEWIETYGGIPPEAVYAQQLAAEGNAMISTGPSLLISGIWAGQWANLPPEYLLIHYPLLFAAFLALFATALNLLPIGQLDGGHIVYAMFGPKIAGIVSRIAVLGLLLVGGTGLVDLRIDGWLEALNLLAYAAFLVYVFQKILDEQPLPMVLAISGVFLLAQGILFFLLPNLEAQFIWLLYTLLVVRVVKLDHPPAYQFFALDRKRKLLGWLAFLIFLLCFSPFPLRVIGLVEMDWSW
jgi:membrane-associated protease RseP (regulator of RpoE activity)